MTRHPDNIDTRDTLAWRYTIALLLQQQLCRTLLKNPSLFPTTVTCCMYVQMVWDVACAPVSRPSFFLTGLLARSASWLCTVIYDLMLKSNTVDAHHHSAMTCIRLSLFAFLCRAVTDSFRFEG